MTAIIVTLMLAVLSGFAALFVHTRAQSRQATEEIRAFAAAQGFQFRESMPIQCGPGWLEHFSLTRIDSIESRRKKQHIQNVQQ